MDFTSGAFPDAGWGAIGGAAKTVDPDRWSRSHSASGGPNATYPNYIQLTQLPHPSPGAGNDYGGQFGWGWDGGTIGTNPSYGDTRYQRMYVYFPATCNGYALNWPDGSEVRMTVKWAITGNGNPDRLIPGYEIDDTGSHLIRFLCMIDGGDGYAETGFSYALGTWHAVQVEWTYSSSPDATDASWKMWINTDTYGSPTLSMSGHVMNPQVNSNDAALGYFPNMGLDADRGGTAGVHIQRLARYEWDTAFDAAWAAGMA